MKKALPYICFVVIALVVGAAAGILTMNSMDEYEAIAKPSFSPPGWLFPVVWSILYIMMGIAAAIIWKSDSEYKTPALILYAAQLAVNFFWPIIFFNFGAYLFSFIWLVFLLILVLAATYTFSKTSQAAAWLLIPYTVWLIYAAVLNFEVWRLNG